MEIPVYSFGVFSDQVSAIQFYLSHYLIEILVDIRFILFN